MSKTVIDTEELKRLERDANDNKSLIRLVRTIALGVLALVIFFTIALVFINSLAKNWLYNQQIQIAMSHFNGEMTVEQYIELIKVVVSNA